ncbi:hypothetical protein CERZMDRAFT_87364 [Cercospora zeae-maydis SCOH1-5]|uniref:Uncharacterized protein n=1 Tax=Cercospora zeae-maydis SCOH1-5 TaxID=717836 RepID=A0A6A6F6A4_9PEZI|nr:hypothetical protein CERZMDRAFT_87364 [Cercospora zeae-maydis SCOH1-5]
MKLTSSAIVIVAAALQGSLLVAANEYEVRTYTTEEPTVVEYTTAYETPCTTQMEYPDPPEYVTETITQTYFEPGKTIKRYKTVTGTKTLPPKTRTVTTTFITTTTEVYKKTIYKPVTYTETATVTDRTTDTATVTDRTTDTATVTDRTTDTAIIIKTSVIVSEVTRTRDGSTFIQTTTITQPTTIVISQPAPPPVVVTSLVTEERTTTLPTSTITTTIVSSGTTLDTTITLPPSVVVETATVTQIPDTVTINPEAPPAQIVTPDAPPAETVTITVMGPTQITTVSPPAPQCSETGLVPVSDTAGCQGRSCQIEFQEAAAVYWSDDPERSLPPLRTAITFINTDKRQTCITTSCNTEAFSQFYFTSRTACVSAPCPSNSINQDCSIVVGPLVLPNSQTTSVTQIGSSGWNLRLGPTATANDIGLCGGGVASCVTATSRTLTTPLIYVGDVIPVTGNNTGAIPTNYLLPQIGEYFAPGDPIGACETATLNSLGGYGLQQMLRLRARQRQEQIDPKLDPWPGMNQLIVREVHTVGNAESVEVSSTPSVPSGTSAEPTVSASEQSGPSASPGTQPDAQPTATAVPAPVPAPDTASPPSNDNSSLESATPQNPATASSTEPEPQPSASGPDFVPPDTIQPSPTDSATDSASASSFVVTGDNTENISGTMVVTNTVYYSMVAPPNQQRLLEAISSLQTEIATLPPESLGQVLTSLVLLGEEQGQQTPDQATASETGAEDDATQTTPESGGAATATSAGEGVAAWRKGVLEWWVAGLVGVVLVM